uniref:Bactericidal permeability-increasing protein n=1 Tax=Sinocyclocheilus grahami TaxID=75366 RepID=A0A672KMZ3_SINGR
IMFLWCVLVLVSLLSVATGTSAGVKARITQKGLEYGRAIGIESLQQKLRTIQLKDVSGTEKLAIGKVEYSITGMQIVNLGLPKSALRLVAGTGVMLSVGDAYISLRGNWRVKYSWIIKASGSFELAVSELAISTTIAVKSDVTGRPTVSVTKCEATVGSVKVRFISHTIYLLFQICPLVTASIAEMNKNLKTLNVLAKVDQYAELEYSMVESPVISNAMIDLGLKGEFYNIGQHKEPPFSPRPFLLPSQDTNMLYIGVSAFSINSAGFVYHRAGALCLYITNDMIPSGSLNRLNTRTFGKFIPQIGNMSPGLMMKLLVETVKEPIVTLEPNNMTVQASSKVTAYAIQPNSILSPLFVLKLEASVIYMYTARCDLAESYVGPFQVTSLEDILTTVVKDVIIPKVNAGVKEGYPLPAIGKMQLVKSQLQVLKDYLLIGTDVTLTG